MLNLLKMMLGMAVAHKENTMLASELFVAVALGAL